MRGGLTGSAQAVLRLTELDRDVLELVCWLRVVTQVQLEALWPETPARTLRYRTRRLCQLRLLGRSRPYRERGSAPQHLWPTARADALVRGEPAPRRGGRREPNPLFLAHASTIAELYVTFATRPPQGTRLDGFDREHDAREPFIDLAGRERAVAPDATIAVRDDNGRRLLALVELDLGTMSRTRLKTKARGYADWHRARAWREQHVYQPALLFLTTSRYRADAFRHLFVKELNDGAHSDPLVVATGANVSDLARAIGGPFWRQLGDDEPTDLVTVLEAARAPYDHDRAAVAFAREEFARMLGDPVALHAHLQQHERATPDESAFGTRGGRALGLLLANQNELIAAERVALGELSAEMDDRHGAEYATIARTPAATEALERLGDAYAEWQVELVTALRERHGDGPHLRDAARRLASGELLDNLTVRSLPDSAGRDRQQHEHQAELRLAYLDQREEEARQLARAGGIATRVRGAQPHLTTVDQRQLRVCPRCDELVYPEPDRQLAGSPPCPYCGTTALEAWTPAWSAEHAGAGAPTELGSDGAV